MRLRKMSAHVTEEKNITIELANGQILNLENALVLHSYDSRVAVYCDMRVYLLPRYDYSVTTWKHVHAFIQDYCSLVWDSNSREMREIATLGVDDVQKEYAFAKGIVEGVPVENVNCEGCVLLPVRVSTTLKKSTHLAQASWRESAQGFISLWWFCDAACKLVLILDKPHHQA